VRRLTPEDATEDTEDDYSLTAENAHGVDDCCRTR
jgi:hypothetical protein